MKVTEKRLRSSRWLRGRGIEIGALNNPLPMPDGVEVTYVDRLPVDELRRQHPGLTAAVLVPVDLVCEAEKLSPIPDGSQDFVVANHVLEYLGDPLRGLSEMARVLKTGGILHLALSDPRASSSHEPPRTRPPGGRAAGGGSALRTDPAAPGSKAGLHPWQPAGFLEVVAAARRDAGVALELLEFSACHPGVDDEYILVFAKGEAPTAAPREDAVQVERDHLQAEVARLQPALARTTRQLAEADGVIRAIQRTAAFRAADVASRAARRLLPPQSRRRASVRRFLGGQVRSDSTAGPTQPDVLGEPGGARAVAQRVAVRGAQGGPRLALLILGRAGGDAAATLRSLEKQSWEAWQAILIGAGASSEPEGDAARNPRVRRHSETGPAAINAVLADLPRETMVIFLEAGDTLSPGCLYEVAACMLRDPLVELVTWDDEVPAERGPRHVPRLRPSWSPELLLSADYLDGCFAIRASRAQDAGCTCPEAGTALLWDLILRCNLAADRVTRVPKVLSRRQRRAAPAPEDAVRVVANTLERRRWPASAMWAGEGVVIEWALPSWPRMSVVIPTRHNRDFVGPLLDGLARSGYPELEVVIVDNGPRTSDNERWYGERPLRPTVIWWDQPFNYSAVNNAGARAATGSVLLFLNDDIRVGPDPSWLKDLAGWAAVEEIGSVGMQLLDIRGRIQHGGVILGLTGFAGHLFAGLRPRSATLLGSTSWYRNVLAVTAACVAVRRRDFEAVGGFDEAFTLCGSDVVLGLALRRRGLRNLCLPSNALTHLKSATRGAAVPPYDYFVSWWHYQRWIRSGDPYFHPRLSLQSTAPHLRRRGEPTAAAMVGPHIGRELAVWHSQNDLSRAEELARRCRFDPAALAALREQHRRYASAGAPRTVNWFIPELDSPFYGGINTALRIAAKLAADHRVENRFVVCGEGPEEYIRSGISVAFPVLAASPILIAQHDEQLTSVPEADAAVATLWTTAYQVAAHPGALRKFYLVQDFEPMFYPAGTLYALAEESYRLGLYGISNTENLARIYRSYGGTAWHFTPAVDTTVFHARGRVEHGPEAPVTLFFYARPGHWRNCWELALPALNELKQRLGDRIRILAAGSWAEAGTSLPSMTHLGLLDYAETGDLYRHCDMGLVLTVSEHPSYLPLELMACGAPVVAFDNPAGGWLLRDGVNCLLAPRTVDGLAEKLEVMAVDTGLRGRLAGQALADIAERHSDWDAALAGLYDFLADPERVAAVDVATVEVEATHRGGRPVPNLVGHG